MVEDSDGMTAMEINTREPHGTADQTLYRLQESHSPKGQDSDKEVTQDGLDEQTQDDLEKSSHEIHESGVYLESKVWRDTCESGDRLAKINKSSGEVLAQPNEIRLEGFINHKDHIDDIDCEVIVDLGAGKSYFLLPPKYSYLNLLDLKNPLAVQFADESSYEIRHGMIVNLTLRGLDGTATFRKLSVQLYVIRLPHQAVQTIPQILLGRNLIQEFQIDVFSAKRAMIGEHVLYDDDSSDNESIARLRDTDRMNWMKQLVPMDLLDDLVETREEESVPMTQRDVTVWIGDTDEKAPYGRVCVEIPWLNMERPDLNYRSTWTRDILTTRRLDPNRQRLYKSAMEDLLKSGFVRNIEIPSHSAKHYLAIRPVFTDNSDGTMKIRLCLDARVFNKFAISGPTMLAGGVKESILKFRLFEFIISFDLIKAFLQISLLEQDQDWFHTIVSGTEYQFLRMPFGTIFSPRGLDLGVEKVIQKGVLRLAENQQPAPDEPPRPPEMKDTHRYVDDFIAGANGTSASLREMVIWTRWWLDKHGFCSSKIAANFDLKGMDDGNVLKESSYLGYKWHVERDTMEPKRPVFNQLVGKIQIRQVVQVVASYFDPCGFHLKVQLYGRLIIRRAFEENKERSKGMDRKQVWNLTVSQEIVCHLHNWMNEVDNLHEEIPRWVHTETVNVYVDASQFCWAYEVRDTNMQLVIARGGLTSTGSSIPRSELSALYHAVVDLMEMMAILKPSRVYIFTDSQCNVFRLKRNVMKLPQFERLRIEKMQLLLQHSSVPVDVAHIPGSINPSDFPSRPLSTSPRPPLEVDMLRAYQFSRTTTRIHFPGGGGNPLLIGEDTDSDSDMEFEGEIDHINIMTLRSFKRRGRAPITQEMDRTESEFQDAGQHVGTSQNEMEVDQVDIDDAHEEDWNEDENDIELETTKRIKRLRESQGKYLTNNLEDNESSSYSIDQYGLYRWRGRVILPSEDSTLIRETLERLHSRAHLGASATTRIVKKHYYFENFGRIVRSYVAACDTCQRARNAKAIRSSAGEALKDMDVSSIPVGGVVGIDICQIESSREDMPCCVVTATCLLTKWIRIGAMKTQLSSEIVQTLEMMFSLSHFPAVLVMDNAPNFRKSKAVKKFSVKHGIRLCYLPVYSSPYAGWIERSHSSVLTALRTLKLKEIDRDWTDLIPEATYLINSRPYSDEESELSPLHLVFGNARIVDPEFPFSDVDELMKAAGVLHLAEPPLHTSQLKGYYEKSIIRRKKNLKTYEQVYKKRRKDVQDRLRQRLKDLQDAFPPGAEVMVFRPVNCKVNSCWSEPRLVVSNPSAATRIVERADGQRSLESVNNLKMHVRA